MDKLENETKDIAKPIRGAKQEDLPFLLKLWEASVRSTHLFITEEDILFYKDVVKNVLSGPVTIYCIEIYEAVYGFMVIDKGSLEMLFIDPVHLHQGLGTLMLQFAIKNGVNTVEVNEQNYPAVNFYKRAGFQVLNKKNVDGFGKPYPILVMEIPPRP